MTNRGGLTIGVAVALLLGAVVVACTITTSRSGSSPTCHDRSPCPNDPAPSQDDVDMCEQALASRCKQDYQALLDCVAAHPSCGPAGRSDPEAVRAACASEETAYSQCVPAPPDAAPYPDAGARD
jgi:hypothetical protein